MYRLTLNFIATSQFRQGHVFDSATEE